MRDGFANNDNLFMKPTTFIITVLVALLIGLALFKFNQKPEALAPAIGGSNTAVSTTSNNVLVIEDRTDSHSPSDCGCSKACCRPRKERFEPNTASAPDHRPLF